MWQSGCFIFKEVKVVRKEINFFKKKTDGFLGVCHLSPSVGFCCLLLNYGLICLLPGVWSSYGVIVGQPHVAVISVTVWDMMLLQ